MAAKRRSKSKHDVSEAKTKLTRLLETEQELETMLKEARREGEALVESARAAADDRVARCKAQLEEEDEQLRRRILQDRDQAIDSIRREAQRETERLDELDDARVTELARHVLHLLIDRSGSRGSR
jgi:F0F1-type ATP synthase membrane subunit b/b'